VRIRLYSAFWRICLNRITARLLIRRSGMTPFLRNRPTPESPARPSESVLWSGRVGLFHGDILIVTTRRVIFKYGSAWTVLRLSEIDTVDVSEVQLLLTTRGITHRVDFRKKKVANEVARVIFENMLRQ
jgi:hypothetical protein